MLHRGCAMKPLCMGTACSAPGLSVAWPQCSTYVSCCLHCIGAYSPLHGSDYFKVHGQFQHVACTVLAPRMKVQRLNEQTCVLCWLIQLYSWHIADHNCSTYNDQGSSTAQYFIRAIFHMTQHGSSYIQVCIAHGGVSCNLHRINANV